VIIILYKYIDWIHLAQDRVSGRAFEDGYAFSDYIKGGYFLE
jgi:hypothetical protein